MTMTNLVVKNEQRKYNAINQYKFNKQGIDTYFFIKGISVFTYAFQKNVSSVSERAIKGF